MATAVKVDEDAKSRLEELQAEIKLTTGEKVSQQAILTRLIEDAYESKSEFVESFRETSVPLSDEDIQRLHDARIESGQETDEDDIDDVLYG